MEEIEFSRCLFEGKLGQGKNVLPEGQNWLCYFAGNSKSHRENSIFFHIFGIPSSSRHKKRCQLFVRLFCLFQCSRKQQCLGIAYLYLICFPCSSWIFFARPKSMIKSLFSSFPVPIMIFLGSRSKCK